jgi:hypothetical protein
MTDDGSQVLHGGGHAVFKVEENSYGRIITGMISADAQIAGLRAILKTERRRGIVRVIEGRPTLITSPLLIRQFKSREVFEMVVSVSGIASWVTAAALALVHLKPWVAIVGGLAVGYVAWSWYVGIQQARARVARAVAAMQRAIRRPPS